MNHDTAFSLWWSKWSRWILALVWFLGLLFGFFTYLSSGESFTTLIHQAIGARPSAFAFGTLLLPFLFSVIAVYLSKPLFLLMISFFKGFLMMFISSGVFFSYESAGWLIRVLLMFSSIFYTPVLYLYWHRHICGYRGFSFRNSIGYLLPALLLTEIDHTVFVSLVVSF